MIEQLLEPNPTGQSSPLLQAQDLLAGSQIIHTVDIPAAILYPQSADAYRQPEEESTSPHAGTVQIKPLTLQQMTLISRAARDDGSLVPLLMVKEAVVAPVLSLDQVRQMHVGLVHFLVSQVNQISGLSAEGEVLNGAVQSPVGQTHLMLARHFGWTPDQVSQLTPGQVAVYLAGIEQFLNLDEQRRQAQQEVQQSASGPWRSNP